MPLDVKWPFPPSGCASLSWTLTSRMTVAAVGIASKIWAEWLNKIHVHNITALHDAVESRPKGQPLITVSNHLSCCDDPVLWGVLKWRHLVTNNTLMRWTLAASEICFSNEFHSTFFSRGQTVPVCRGEGVYQRAMDFMIEKLNEGQWVHTFPEGRVNESKELIRLKWGVGRLVAESNTVPIVLPMWHVGMDRILPNKTPYIPHVGKKVTLVIGEPMKFEALLKQLKSSKLSPMAVRKEITDRIQEEFSRLKPIAEQMDKSTCK